MALSCYAPTPRSRRCRRCCDNATCSRSKTCSCEPRRWGRGRSSIPPTLRYGTMYFVLSLRSPCRSAWKLSRQAGIVPECKTLLHDLDRLQQVRIRHQTIGWSAPTSRSRSPICSATPTSRCRHAPSKWRHRNSRRPRNPPGNAADAPRVVPRRREFRQKPHDIGCGGSCGSGATPVAIRR